MEQNRHNKILLLVNTGTPDSPAIRDVRRYLSGFLNDKRVIDLAWLLRKVLVNFIIVPFRAPRSAKLYRRLWTEDGSPLRDNLERLVSKVQERIDSEYHVMGAMRYGNPSLKGFLESLRKNPPRHITILPLFPQYASSTTGSVSALIMEEIAKWDVIPSFNIISQFYNQASFIDAFTDQVRKYDPAGFDHILFSYHSLPVSHIQKMHPESDCLHCSCDIDYKHGCEFCYKAACYQTTRLLTESLKLDPEKTSTAFQSRLSKNWLSPFTDMKIRELAAGGGKNLLVVAPSFVSDCLETVVEIGEEYRNEFSKNGGIKLVLSESLNYNDKWADSIVSIVNAV